MIIEIGTPKRKLFTSKKEIIDFININNGKKTSLFQSVYCFKEMNDTKPKYETAIINKLFFDFDFKDGNCWEECNKLYQYLLKKDIKHQLIFSGRGFHMIIYTTINILQNSKSTIYNAQMFFINKLNLICDKQIVGDISRLRRIPNSFHLKAQRFCIYLLKEDFSKGYEHCKELAKKQNFNKSIIGNRLFDIKSFDHKSEKHNDIIFNEKIESNLNLNYLNNCPKFILNLLSNKNAGWNDRYLLILFFRDSGYTREEVFQILKDNLTERKFKHCVYEERQLQYLFERYDLCFPEKYCKIYK